MKSIIKAIFFDIGGTLRTRDPLEERDMTAIQQMMDLLGDTSEPHDFVKKILEGHKSYRSWGQKTLIELDEKELWVRFLLPEYPPDFIRSNASQLHRLWRESGGKRDNYPGAFETIKALSERGYILGVISNTSSSTEVPDFLEQEGVTELFKTVILSSVVGKRKPHPSPFLKAASNVGVLPENCAYVGNWPSRDLVGPREAGFGEVVIFEPSDDKIERVTTPMRPDFTIHNLPELLNLYPDRNQIKKGHSDASLPRVRYDAALSTMWGVDQKCPFTDTFRIAREIGFARFELNHKVSPQMLSEIDLNQYRIGNVHDPCPAEIPLVEQAHKDWMISSPNEENRLMGVKILRHTIDTAVLLGAKSVIVHCGGITGDRSQDRELRKLYEMGQRETPEYEDLRQSVMADRKHKAEPFFMAVITSLKEVIEYARSAGVEIGLENRYRYYDIPIVDELQPLLDLCAENWFGFQYDVGHAHTLDALGLCNHQEWLERYGQRMIGTHLHDVIGITDHQVPGSGDVDFTWAAQFIPASVYRTLEIGPQASVDEITTSLEVLADAGIINRL